MVDESGESPFIHGGDGLTRQGRGPDGDLQGAGAGARPRTSKKLRQPRRVRGPPGCCRRDPAEAGRGSGDRTDVATIAVETRPARTRRELTEPERAMRPWHDAPVGRDLAAILAPVTERN